MKPLEFETDGLYIIVTDIGYEALYHWGLYLAQGRDHGQIFHMINGPRSGGQWEYQMKPSEHDPYVASLLVALKIGVIEPVLQQALADALAEVPVDAPVTCRVWLQRALDELHQRGFVWLHGGIAAIEQEAQDQAFQDRARRERSVEQSRWSGE